MFDHLIMTAIVGLAEALFMWGVIRTEMRWHRRDIDKNETNIEKQDERSDRIDAHIEASDKRLSAHIDRSQQNQTRER